MKIIDKIRDLQQQQRPFYSFEYFPPKTEAGLHNLYARLDRMAGLEPAFIDVTWGAGGTTSDTSLELSQKAQKYFGLDVMMHLTCTNMTRDQVAEVLDRVREAGIRNLMALRGDPPEGTDTWERPTDGFAYAADLIEFIRERHGDYFGIAVGGYPEGHLEADDKDTCIQHLKHKVDAGADFIVTQLFYDVNEYFDYEKRARAAGVKAPIIPGVMPIQTYQRFQRFTQFCGIKVPKSVQAALEPIKNDDQQVQAYGVELCVDMAKQLLDHGAPGLHFYTLNLETSVNRILEKLNLAQDCRTQRALPWRSSTLPGRRDEEDVRPIFWSNRPKSYLARTQSWDDFPNGRWGDSRSPTFGNLDDYYLLRRSPTQKTERERRLGQWGHPTSTDEVGEVFAQFCEGKISLLPWCEVEVQTETGRIAKQLARLNRHGGSWGSDKARGVEQQFQRTRRGGVVWGTHRRRPDVSGRHPRHRPQPLPDRTRR